MIAKHLCKPASLAFALHVDVRAIALRFEPQPQLVQDCTIVPRNNRRSPPRRVWPGAIQVFVPTVCKRSDGAEREATQQWTCPNVCQQHFKRGRLHQSARNCIVLARSILNTNPIHTFSDAPE